MKKVLFLCSAICGTCLCLTANGQISDSEWQKMKQEALAKPRPVIANNDGCDATTYPKGSKNEKITLDDFYNLYLGNFKNSKVTTITYTPYSVGLGLSVPTKVSEQLFIDMPWIKHYNIVKELYALTGKDPMQLAMEYARKNGLEFFASIRANDCHDMHFKGFIGNIKKQHPDWLVGSNEKRPLRGEWTAYDFGHPEVRKLFVNVVTEIMENYDIDGMEIDFCRMTLYFKSVAWNKPVTQEEINGMTDAIRQIRANAERIGRSRKHPIIMLFHLPDNPGVCREMGLDMETWMKEGLFDILAAGSDRGNYDTAENVAKLCKKYNIQFYAGVCDPYTFQGVFSRRNMAAYHGEQAYRLAAGAKGTWLFNMHYSKQCLHEIATDLNELKFKNKVYFTAHQHENNYGVKPDSYKKYNRVPELTPWKEFYGARKKDYIIQVGDDFNDPEIKAMLDDEKPYAILYLDVLGKKEDLDVYFNGTLLQPGQINGTVVEYKVDTAIIKRGVNIMTLDSTRANGTFGAKRLLFDGKSGIDGRPWWSIYRTGVPNTKGVENGAFKMNDTLAVKTVSKREFEAKNSGQVNLLRTFSGMEGTPVKMVFDLKTQAGNNPETAVLRLADGRNLEVIDFRPDKVVLKYSKKQAKFNTADNFHRYTVIINDGKLSLYADGNILMSNVSLALKAGDPRAVLRGHNYMIPADSNLESMIFGSINGPGTGSSLWKNFYLYSDMLVADAALHVIFPPRLPGEIREKMNDLTLWKHDFDFSSGKMPSGSYTSNYVKTPAQKGGILLDNEIGSNKYMGMTLTDPAVVSGNSRFRVAEWEVEAVRKSAADAAQMVFQFCFRVGTDQKSYLNSCIGINHNSMETPWGKAPLTAGSHRYRMIIDTRDKFGALLVDDKLIFSGAVATDSGTPVVMWGDLSGSVGGAAVLKNVRFSEYPSLGKEFDSVKARISRWNTMMDFSHGSVPEVAGLTSNYPVKTAADGAFLLDNESGNQYKGMFWKSDDFTAGKSRYRIARWEVKPETDAVANEDFSVFQFVAKISADGGVLTAFTDCNSRRINTPWGSFPAADAAMRFLMIVDTKEKNAAVYLNDKLLACGRLTPATEEAGVMWGDLSGSVGGSAVLKEVAFTTLD